MTNVCTPPLSPGRHQIISKLTCIRTTQFLSTFQPSPGCPVTGHPSVSDNHNGFLVVLELPLEAPTVAAGTLYSVCNTPNFERPLPFHGVPICYPGDQEERS